MGKVLVLFCFFSPLFVFLQIYLCIIIIFIRTKDPTLAFLASGTLAAKFSFHVWSTTRFQLPAPLMLVLRVMDFCHLFFFFLLWSQKGGEKHPVIWIHSLEELYKILTILPGAKLELDAVRINWWSFAKRVEKTSFAKSKSYKPPAGVVRGRLVGIVAAYVWCQEHHWFAFLLYEFYKAEMLFCVEVIPKVSVAINHKWNLSADEKP